MRLDPVLEELLQEAGPLGRVSGLFPISVYRVGNRSDLFTFSIEKTGEKRYTYGPFNREKTKSYLRELDARIGGLAWIPMILDATKKKRKAWIKVDASILAKIWRGLNPRKKYAYWADRVLRSGEVFYLEELEAIMNESTQPTSEDLLDQVNSYALEFLREYPEIRMHYKPDTALDLAREFLKRTHPESLEHADSVVSFVEYHLGSTNSSNLVELVLQGVSPDALVSALTLEDAAPVQIGRRVKSTRDIRASTPCSATEDHVRVEGNRTILTSGAPGTVSDLDQDRVTVSFDAGPVESFTFEHYQHYFQDTLEPTTESIRIGDQISMNGASWEVSGLDYSTNKALLIDPAQRADPIYIDLPEIEDNLSSGRWKMLSDES